jgi:hypothetical protein
VLALACLAGCRAGAFTCEDESDCADGERLGTCQLDGFCSFPDDDCPSGQRYGAHAGVTSGECVPSAGTTGTSDEPSSSGVAGTSDDAPSSLDDTSPADTSTSGATTSPITIDPTSTTSASETTTDTGEVGPELALWLQFEDLDFESGLVDDSSWHHDASCPSTCPTSVPGWSGNGARFDGVATCVVVPHGEAFVDLDAVTLSAFVMIEGEPPTLDAHMIVGKPVGVTDRNSFELFMSDNDLADMMMRANVAVSDGDSFLTVNAPSLSASEEWIHVAGTWDGATATLWLDGIAVDSGMYPTMVIDEHAVYVGCDDDTDDEGDDNVFAGVLDEIRIYREALTAEQIAALAAGGEP